MRRLLGVGRGWGGGGRGAYRNKLRAESVRDVKARTEQIKLNGLGRHVLKRQVFLTVCDM